MHQSSPALLWLPKSLAAESVSFLNDVLKFSISIDGGLMPFTGKLAGNSITGSVETPDGTIAVNAVRLTLEGTWEYKVPDAPAEYSTGRLIFTEKEGKMTCSNLLPDGTLAPIPTFKAEGVSFAFTIEIEYNPVKVAGKIVNGIIEGSSETPDGTMKFTATRVK
jgi:hypothetical protein